MLLTAASALIPSTAPVYLIRWRPSDVDCTKKPHGAAATRNFWARNSPHSIIDLRSNRLPRLLAVQEKLDCTQLVPVAGSLEGIATQAFHLQ